MRALPWWEPLDGPAAGPTGSDVPRPGEIDLAADLTAARAVLGPEALARYRSLCRDSAAATGAALRRARPGDSEFALAGRAARELYEREIEPIVMLVAGAERLPLHRHPLPTAAPLGDLAMLVVCGRRDGLVSAVTRMRAFRPLDAGARARYAALLEVEAAYLDATRAGARIGDVVAAGAAAYAEHGFAADEWHAHHQGGPMGYTTRDYLAHPGTDDVVVGGPAVRVEPVRRRLQGRGHDRRRRRGAGDRQPRPRLAGARGRRSSAARRAGLNQRGQPVGVLEPRQVGDLRHPLEPRARDPGGDPLALLVHERDVQLADHDRGRDGDVLEPRPGVHAGLAGVLGNLVGEDRAVHRERELARRAADAALGAGRAVEPQPRVEPRMLLQALGLARTARRAARWRGRGPRPAGRARR